MAANYMYADYSNTKKTSTTFGNRGIHFVGVPSSSLHQSTWSCLGRHLFSSFLSMLLDFPSSKAGQRKQPWKLDERQNPFNMQTGTKRFYLNITAVFMFCLNALSENQWSEDNISFCLVSELLLFVSGCVWRSSNSHLEEKPPKPQGHALALVK